MTLILLSLEPMLMCVGVADQSVRSPHGRANKIEIAAADERPPPN